MNVKKLRAMMVLHDDNITTLAQKMGIARSTLSAKMNERREFVVKDLLAITDVYNLTGREVDAIFFSGSKSAAHSEATEKVGV